MSGAGLAVPAAEHEHDAAYRTRRDPQSPVPPSVDTVDCVAAFSALEPEWKRLLGASESDCLFLSWEWLHTWWRHLAGRRRLRVLAVREGGRLIAVAPFVLAPPQPRRLAPFRAFEFLATGMVGSDYLDVVAERGREDVAASAVARSLLAAGRPLVMAQVSAGGSAAARVADLLEEGGWAVRRSVSDVCPFVRFDGGWDAYYEGLGPYHRRSLRRERKRAEKLHRVAFRTVAGEPERAQVFPAFLDLHYRRWDGARGSQALADPRVVAFHEEFSALALRRGWLRMSTLSFDGRPAAAVYGFAYGPRFYYYQSGFDPEFARLSAGRMCLEESLKSAAEEGLPEYDLLHGAEDYKFLWARHSRQLLRYEAYPPTLAGRASRGLADARARIGRAVRARRTSPVPRRKGPGLREAGRR